METATQPTAPAIAPLEYIEGKILKYSWGYEQTNIDFYRITKRAGAFVTLQKLEAIKTPTGDMFGTCVPGEPIAKERPIRRKIRMGNGREIGTSIESYGWARLWDGKPAGYTSYA